MLVATVLALAAAVLHALWNLAAKRSAAPFVALWGQFAVAGIISGVVIVAAGGLPAAGWRSAALTGLIHVPYLAALAKAYEQGDFSLAYPIARGGGAMLAAIGGILLLDDELSVWAVLAIVTITGGMMLLASGAAARQVATALVVAAAIGAYTLNDSHAAREIGGSLYPFAVFAAAGVAVSAYGIAVGRAGQLLAAVGASWRQFTLTAVMAVATYTMVLLAVQRAPVGYVAALRESSVLLAAFLGARYLDEGGVRRRALAAAVIVCGMVMLLVTG